MRHLTNRLPLIALICLAGLSASLLEFSELPLTPITFSELTSRFLSVIFLALVVERGVEIYMNLGRDSETSVVKSDRLKSANRAALWLSFAVALCGVRVIAQLMDTAQIAERLQNPLQLALFRAVDITITTLLLAGGADGLHQILNRLLKPQTSASTSV
jgi:hypothetical protein